MSSTIRIPSKEELKAYEVELHTIQQAIMDLEFHIELFKLILMVHELRHHLRKSISVPPFPSSNLLKCKMKWQVVVMVLAVDPQRSFGLTANAENGLHVGFVRPRRILANASLVVPIL
ncbi:hypothetical protein TorRG33x02_085810 [Trema orientale]|uniref:Uncharacterized protein n=1 Tax=Trema orientale TaxID=63057 RepID=A0A2P5FD76_TREOI|nr:hypothetical protein TorRG33x02_085810 [Trema orientale]